MDTDIDIDILFEEEVKEVNCECGVVIISSNEQKEDYVIICPNCDKEHRFYKR